MASHLKHIAVIQGHPDPQGRHYCHALADAHAAGAREAEHAVEMIDIARLEFPFLRSRADVEHGSVPDAIREAQAVLTRSDHIVLIYPVWNGAMPALKGFLEQTFRSTFILPDAKPGERLGFSSYFSQRKALTGKSGRVIATMQMPAFVYRWCFQSGEMSEWSIEHAWKTKRATDTEPRRSTVTHTDQQLNPPDRLLNVRR